MFKHGKKYYKLALVVIVAACISSCRHPFIKADRAFYYWRSNLNLSNTDVNYLQNVGVTRIYLHFFDVSWDETYKKVLPVDEVKFDSISVNSLQFIPVIYIANKALEETPEDSINSLSRHVWNEIKHIAFAHKLKYDELQFDCDWTDGTKSRYFGFLSSFHDSLKANGRLLSATIRLHQVKYKEKTGVPPIDRGMLMFYNMGKVNAIAGYNSIYNDRDADNYASYVKSYPLPLDLALPIFGWAVIFRDGKVKGVNEKAIDKDYTDTSHFLSAGNNIFVSRSSFFLHGRYFMKSDTVKLEEVTPEICEDASRNVSRYLKNEKRTISLFDYDSLYLSTYDKKDLEQIFSLSR